jgi:hypothetical protein
MGEVMKRKALTLVELIVAALIILVVVVMAAGLFGFLDKSEFVGTVEQKYTILDGDGVRVYRVMVRKENGEADEWNSYHIHDKVLQGQTYKFTARGSFLTGAVLQPPAMAE